MVNLKKKMSVSFNSYVLGEMFNNSLKRIDYDSEGSFPHYIRKVPCYIVEVVKYEPDDSRTSLKGEIWKLKKVHPLSYIKNFLFITNYKCRININASKTSSTLIGFFFPKSRVGLLKSGQETGQQFLRFNDSYNFNNQYFDGSKSSTPIIT